MSDKNFVLIQNGIVVNIVAWDGVSEVDFGEGIDVEPLEEGVAASKGYSFKNGVFTPPALTADEVAAQTAAEKANNEATKISLMDMASQKISVLQDAVDLDMATEAETAALPDWKKYRVLLNRIDSGTSGVIDWPTLPAETETTAAST